MSIMIKYFGFSVAAALLVLTGCGGAQQAQTVPVSQQPQAASSFLSAGATSSVTPPPFSGSTLLTTYGHYDKSGVYHYPVINGTDNKFSPQVGDTTSGGHGAAGSSDDGVNCEVSMSRNYHIHVFLGLYVNGQEYALPRGAGVSDPTSTAKSILYATRCFYSVHTHDETGIIHVEDLNNGVVEKPATTTKYTLGQFFALYGITVTPNNFGAFTGPVRVFTSGAQYRYISPTGGGTIPESTLQYWSADPNTIPLYNHMVIWFMVGPTYPTSLPSINFAPGY